MASLGGLYFSVGLKDYTDKDWEKIEKKLKDRGLDLGLSIDGNKLNSEIIKALSNRKYTIDLDVAINDKQLEASIRSAYGRITNIGQVKPSSEAALIRASAYADSQKSLAQSRDALTRLREARLADAAAAGKQVAANKRFTKSLAPIPRMLEGLREQFLNFYSIYTVERFFTQLVSIGGEFEKQHIALQSMLGDAAKADRIFSQIKELAIESPYTFQNLASYTKQLTAFSVPYNELYETTKRLADISAGLGVDMSRLILAFGQVRSAEFLRGTELRQFTEAGIPILDELAQKFTELEGTVVSVGEVFDRISNREVPFEMVRDVLWDLTNEGGQFYKMQEVLTESLSGRLDKLKDSYQIMLSEVSSSNSGFLKGMIDMATALVDSWRGVWSVLRGVLAAYIGYKAAILYVNTKEAAKAILKARNVALTNAETTAILRNIASMKTQNAVMAKYLTLRKTLNKMKFAKGGVWGLVAGAVLALGSAIWSVTRQAAELRRELNKIDKETGGNVLSLTANYKALVNDLGRATEGTKEYRDIIAKINSGYGDYLDNLFSEAEAYDNVRNSIDAVSDAIIRKAQNQAYEQKIIAISNKYGEKFGQVQEDLTKAINWGGQGLNADMSGQVAARIVALVRSYGYSLEEAINIASQEFGKDVEKAFKRGTVIRNNAYESGRIGRLEQLVTEYEQAINNVSRTDQSGPFQAGLDKIADLYDELIKKAKDLNEERNLEIAKLQEQRRYIESLDFSGKDKMLSNIDRQIAAYREGTEEWIRISGGVAKRGVSQGGYDFSFNNLAPTKEEYRKSSEYFSRLVKDYEDTQKKLEELNLTPLSGQDANWQREKARYEARLKTISEIYKSNGEDIQRYLKKETTTTSTGKDDPIAEQWKERLDLMQEAEKEFAKWQALVGTEKASAQLRGSGMYDALGDFDFTDARGEIESFVNNMLDTAITDAQREIAQEGLAAVIDFKYDEQEAELDRALENVRSHIESVTKNWNLFKEILSKTNNRDLAMGLTFGREGMIDYPQMLKDIFDVQMAELDMPYTFAELFENGLDGVPDVVSSMFNEVNNALDEFYEQERERLIEMVEQYQTVADKRKAIEEKLQADLATIRNAVSSGKISPSMGENMANAATSNANYEMFKLAEEYIGFYGALSTYTRQEAEKMASEIQDNIIDAFQNGAISAQELNSELDKLVTQLTRLRNPLSGTIFDGGLAGVFENMRREGMEMMTRSTMDIDKYSKALDEARMQIQNARSYEELHFATQSYNAAQANIQNANAAGRAGKSMIQASTGAMATVAVIDAIIHSINDTIQGIAGATKLMAEMADAYGADTGPGSGWGDAVQFMDTFAEASQYATDAWDSLKSGNIGGVIQGVVGSVTSWFTSFAKYHDAIIQREIEEIQDYIDQVSHLYDVIENRLQYALGSSSQIVVESAEKEVAQLERLQERKAEILSKGILNKTDLKQLEEVSNEIARLQYRVEAYQTGGAYGYQRELLKEQYEMLAEQRRLEGEKKNPDDDALQEYENQMTELQDQIRYFAQDLANELYGIDIKGWAQQIGDALFDAWKKGEDAVQAYRDTVADIMGELMNKVLTMSIIEPAMKELQTYLFGEDGESGAFGDDLEIDDNEVEGFYGFWAKFEETIAAWEKGVDKLNESGKKYGFDLKEMLGGDDLTEGIKGITEDTANLLASYLNAIRQDVSVQRRLWEAFIGGMNFNQINVIAQAQLTQLQAIAVNTKNSADSAASILTLLNSVSNGTRRFYMK